MYILNKGIIIMKYGIENNIDKIISFHDRDLAILKIRSSFKTYIFIKFKKQAIRNVVIP